MISPWSPQVISSISTTKAFAAEADEVVRYSDGMAKYVGTVVRQARLPMISL